MTAMIYYLADSSAASDAGMGTDVREVLVLSGSANDLPWRGLPGRACCY